MEHKGLVSRVEEDLERRIALGQCPTGCLPSEQEMARRYGVSRTTIRGALQGLAARGLIVRHPGRLSRTVALDEALTLESLKLALPEEGRADPGRRRLLEGYFALKREVTVELLAACCEHASKEDLDLLEGACFALREEAHWQEDRRGWMRQEFELLRLVARAVDRPGHALLVHSLEKAFWGLSERVLPALHGEAIEEWALFALQALAERDAQALRRELAARLKAVDERLLNPLAPSHEAHAPPEAPPAPGEEALSGAAGTNRYACRTGSLRTSPTEGLPAEADPTHAGSSDPSSSLATLASSEVQPSSARLEEGRGPMPALSAGLTVPGGSGAASPPASEPPPPPLEEDGLVAAGHRTVPRPQAVLLREGDRPDEGGG